MVTEVQDEPQPSPVRVGIRPEREHAGQHAHGRRVQPHRPAGAPQAQSRAPVHLLTGKVLPESVLLRNNVFLPYIDTSLELVLLYYPTP